jgi:NADH-quinone oxidoreductase subunit L
VSAYAAGIFHLMTHAFFKALLFLGSGAVIHAMSDEQDMRKMGGLWRKLPITYAVMWIGSLALAGIPIFAGYYSKDIILESAFGAHTAVGQYAFWMGIAAAVMTAFYSWRLIFLTFHGTPRADAETMAHAHEAPYSMTAPLILLAVGAMFAGLVGYGAFVGAGRAEFWGNSILVLPAHDTLEVAHHVPTWVALLPVVVALLGIAIAWLAYMRMPDLPRLAAERLRPLYLFLLNKWYFDELYDFLFTRPAHYVGRQLWLEGDGTLIDGLGPDGIAAAARDLAARASRLQTGYLYHYAFAMLAGLVALVTWYMVGRAG